MSAQHLAPSRALNRAERRAREASNRKNLARIDDKVLIGYLSAGHPELLFDQALDLIRLGDEHYGARRFVDPWRIVLRAGCNVSQARNALCRQFLEHPDQPEWLLMLDDDMVPPVDCVEKLIGAAEGLKRKLGGEISDRIVGGLCYYPGPEGRVCVTVFDLDEHSRFKVKDPGWRPDYGMVIPTAGTGAACLLIHRDTLLRLAQYTNGGPNPWFREAEHIIRNVDFDADAYDEQDVGTWEAWPYWVSEDLYFCALANQAGMEVWIHTGVEVGHVKRVVVNRVLHEQAEEGLSWG